MNRQSAAIVYLAVALLMILISLQGEPRFQYFVKIPAHTIAFLSVAMAIGMLFLAPPEET